MTAPASQDTRGGHTAAVRHSILKRHDVSQSRGHKRNHKTDKPVRRFCFRSAAALLPDKETNLQWKTDIATLMYDPLANAFFSSSILVLCHVAGFLAAGLP